MNLAYVHIIFNKSDVSQNMNVNAIDSVIFKHCEQWYRQGYSHNVNLGYIATKKKKKNKK